MAIVSASDGVALYAEAHGDGLPLIFSGAFCTTHENWRAQVDPLVEAGARVILWDYRGHGRSEGPAEDRAYSIEQVVRDLAAVLDWAVPDQPAVLVGLSFGGLASLHFALAEPRRVRALVLVDSGPGFKKAAALESWQAQVERSAQFLETRGFEAFVAGRAGATCIGRQPELPAARAAAASIVAQDPAAVARFGRCIAGPAPAVIDELGDIESPALVIVGEEDEPYLRAAEVLAAKLPRARMEVIAGAGHIVNIEAEAAFNRLLRAFLRELQTKPDA
ncbi:MAG: alpha/beta hydrolase [Myxococcota bacterium]